MNGRDGIPTFEVTTHISLGMSLKIFKTFWVCYNKENSKAVTSSYEVAPKGKKYGANCSSSQR